MEAIVVAAGVAGVFPLLPSHYWGDGRRGHAGGREAKTPLSHRASGSISCRKVPPLPPYNCLHTTLHMCPASFIVYPANIDPLCQEHNSPQFPFFSSPGLKPTEVSQKEPFSPIWGSKDFNFDQVGFAVLQL